MHHLRCAHSPQHLNVVCKGRSIRFSIISVSEHRDVFNVTSTQRRIGTSKREIRRHHDAQALAPKLCSVLQVSGNTHSAKLHTCVAGNLHQFARAYVSRVSKLLGDIMIFIFTLPFYFGVFWSHNQFHKLSGMHRVTQWAIPDGDFLTWNSMFVNISYETLMQATRRLYTSWESFVCNMNQLLIDRH